MQSMPLAIALFLMGLPGLAAERLAPDPRLDPAEVVANQLAALQSNDSPTSDAGIEQTWTFAHPNNKRMTGPLERFTRMLKGPTYRMLLNHQSHQVDQRARSENEAVLAVIVTTPDGSTFGFRWTVQKVTDGEHAGAWMTVGCPRWWNWGGPSDP